MPFMGGPLFAVTLLTSQVYTRHINAEFPFSMTVILRRLAMQ